MAAWWAHTMRLTRPEAHRRVRLAAALDRYGVLRAGLASGGVNGEQAWVIALALDTLPKDLDQRVLALAEAELVRLAGEHDARALRVLGRRILDLLDPQAAEATSQAPRT